MNVLAVSDALKSLHLTCKVCSLKAWFPNLSTDGQDCKFATFQLQHQCSGVSTNCLGQSGHHV